MSCDVCFPDFIACCRSSIVASSNSNGRALTGSAVVGSETRAREVLVTAATADVTIPACRNLRLFNPDFFALDFDFSVILSFHHCTIFMWLMFSGGERSANHRAISASPPGGAEVWTLGVFFLPCRKDSGMKL